MKFFSLSRQALLLAALVIGSLPTFAQPTDRASRANADAKPFDTPPRPIRQPSLEYPFELRRRGITGGAQLDVTISTEGKVVALRHARGSHQEFAQAAWNAVKNWRFQPALLDGKPVAANVLLTIPFVLNAC
ncbi:MAG: energy transducer TonB [Nocardioides sp.]